MAWINTAIAFGDAFTTDQGGHITGVVANSNVCTQSYKVSRTVVLSTAQEFAIKITYKTVDATYSVVGMTESAAKQTSENMSRKSFLYAESRKVYSSDGWEVSITYHETYVESTEIVGSNAAS